LSGDIDIGGLLAALSAPWLAALLAALAVVLVATVLWRQSRHGSARLEPLLREQYREIRAAAREDLADLRDEIAANQGGTGQMLLTSVAELGRTQRDAIADLERRIGQQIERAESHHEALRQSVDRRLGEMRELVDGKLQETLDRRLTESFRQVSERLEAVQKGLGEMQGLAVGVGDLKRVLTNVKSRGTFGEVQLGALLEDILAPGQFARNVKTREDSDGVVEFAVRLPAEGGDGIWLPIDAKFPQEDYQRLQEAAEQGDRQAVDASVAALGRSLEKAARDIAGKYLDPPRTTDFAILFLPTEGLYAEALRQPGMVERLQRECRIVVAGPATLAAILNSLRMGFRTLAIEQRSSEVWALLAAVKTEFERFGEQLARARRQLDVAARAIDRTGTRTRAMARRLRDIESTGAGAAIGFENTDHGEDGEESAPGDV